MNNITFTAFLVASLAATQGLGFWMRNRFNRQFRAFAYFCLAVFVTNLATALSAYDTFLYWVWADLRLLGALGCAVSGTHLLAQLLPTQPQGAAPLPLTRGEHLPGATPAAIFLGIVVILWYYPNPTFELAEVRGSISGLFSQQTMGVEDITAFPPFNIHRLGSHIILLLVAAYVFGTFLVLLRSVRTLRQRTRSPSERVRLDLLFWLGSGTVIAAACQGGLLYYYPQGVTVPIGGVAQLTLVYFLSQTLLQYRLIDLREIVSKAILFFTLSLLVAFSIWLLFWFFGELQNPGGALITLILATGLVLTFYDPLRRALERWTNRLFFRRRHLLREELTALERDLPSLVSAAQILDRLETALKAITRVAGGGIYLWDEASRGYRQERRFGPESWKPRTLLPAGEPLIDAIREEDNPFVVEDIERELDLADEDSAPGREHALRAILANIEELRANVVIPLMGPDAVLGFITLVGGSSEEGFTHDEITILMDLGRRASIVLRTSESLTRLTERERLAALGAMSAGLAHEIRNPLGAIRGAAQLLTVLGEQGEETEEFIGIILEEVDRLNRVVSDFLDYSRPIRLERRRVDLSTVLLQTKRLLETQGIPEGITVVVHVGEERAGIDGDREHLQQVFLNLSRNAIQAMPKGGTLTIGLSHAEAASREDGALLVTFQDTGIGIPKGDLERLFIPFYTTRKKGNGLGLAISQRLIEAHNGVIRVKSSPGEGTTFTIRLPLKSEGEAKATRGLVAQGAT